VTERLSYCPRERRLVARVRLNLPHIEAVRAARTAFLDSHQGRPPRWTKPAGTRTTELRLLQLEPTIFQEVILTTTKEGV
jgi:hypothetical protein